MPDAQLDARVLIVDDEPAIRNGCRRVLAGCGARVEIAQTGREAAQRLAAEPFEVAIIDLIMPSFGGMDVLDSISRADVRAVPIVITAHASIDTAIEAVKRGAFDYLPKPFVPAELVARVERAVRWHHLREEADRRLLELDRERTRLHTIVSSLADGVLIANREGQVVLSNPAARSALGMPEAEGEPPPVEEAIADPHLAGLIRTTVEDRCDDTRVITAEVRAGERVYMARVVSIRTPPGECLGTATVLRDVTDLMSVERAKAQFMRTVAHELKAPLAAVQGFLKVILSGQQLTPDKLRDIVARSSERVEGMAQLVRDLLDLSQADAAPLRHVEPLALPEIVAEVVELHEHLAAAAGVTVQVAIPTDCPLLPADRDDLARILSNLVSNAIKYNRREGEVTIAVRYGADWLSITVADSGLGIPPEALPRLGQEFFRVSSPDRKGIVGTGLGLSLVKRLVASYDGRLEITSQPGEGSAFTVVFPLSPA